MEVPSTPQSDTFENTASDEQPMNGDETFISPYNSPQRTYIPYDSKGAGDFAGPPLVKDTENDHSVANTDHSFTSDIHGKEATNYDNNILKELRKVSQEASTENGFSMSGDASQTECIKSDSGVELVDDKLTEDHLQDNALKELQKGLENESAENPVPVEEVSDTSKTASFPPNPEEQREKIIAEMLESAAETTPNDELSHSERMSISKKMEEEFRSLMIEEQQKKKLQIEGASYAATNGNLSKSANNLNAKATTEESAKSTATVASKVPLRQSKLTPPSRLPTTQSRTSGLARPTSSRSTAPKTTVTAHRSSPSPVRQRVVTPAKPKSTPTTIRISSQNTSTAEKRTPLQPTSLRSKTPLRGNASPRTPQSATALKATQPIPHKSPKSAPLARTPLSTTPRTTRTPSSQSSDNGRPKMPDTRNVQSKIGSLQNAKHTPGGGKVRIESKKVDYSKVQSKCGSFDNANHTPGGGKVKIENRKLDLSHVGSKCGSFDNVTHTPGGGRVKVESKKLDFGKVTSKCGSMDNMKHTPQGGKVKIFHGRVDTSKVQSRVGSKDNLSHTPGGGKVKIENRSLDLSHVKSKCGSLDNAKHVPGGGDVHIYDEAPMFRENAKARIGSLENADHVAGGGDIRIYDEKLQFRESAVPRTDTGFNGIGSLGSSGSVSSM